jgi:signal transduction histidine kinase
LVYRAGEFQPVLSIDQVGINIRGIFCSSDHHVWVASQDGLFCLADGQVTRVLSPKSEANYPAALAEGAGGVIWVAMNTGELLKINGSDMQTFRPSDASLHSRFSAICADEQGTVWIGTLGSGLLRFRDGQFADFSKANGLPFDHISQVLDDLHGNLWLGSPSGLMSLDKKSFDNSPANLPCHLYGLDDGLPTVGCATASQPTGWRARDGRLWFATADGVTSVMPENSTVKSSPPLVVLEEMMVDGAQLPLPAGSAQRATPIRLNPGRHHVEFRFTGLNFSAPERIRFKYYLEGLDATWLDNQSERTARYDSLQPGSYRFHVMACNGDGVWSQTESSAAFIVPPHLWETRWFRFVMLASLILLAGGIVYSITQTQHRRQLRILEQQQALERERTRIAQDIHDDLGSSLTRITMLSQSAMDKNGKAKSSPEEVGRIYATASAMTRTLDEIVWAINPRHDSLDSLAAYLSEFVEEFCGLTGLRFRLDMPLHLPARNISAEMRHSLFLAFKEALNNVAKHAKADEVVVAIVVQEKSFTLGLQDDGCGFDPAAPAQPTGGLLVASHGNGLKNMQRRLAALGGECRIVSATGRGTSVTFTVPLPS